MRRTARALTLAAAVGAVLNVLVPAASAEPSAEVSPGSVAPGGTVTVSVSCDPTDGPPPQTLEATSAAFDGEVVELRKATGADEEESGPAYRGTADIQDVLAAEGTAGTREDEPFDEEIDEELDEVFHEDRDEGLDGDPNEELGGGTGGGAVDGDAENTENTEEAEGPASPADGDAENTENTENTEEAEGPASPADGAFDALTPEAFGALGAVGTEGGGSTWTVEGTCPAAPGGKGEPWSVTFTVVARHPGGSGVPSRAPSPSHPRKPSPSHKPSPSPCPPSEHAHCGGPTVPGGVHAGAGGGSTGSVPALVAGGLLVAGAFGAAAHRLHRARGTRTDR